MKQTFFSCKKNQTKYTKGLGLLEALLAIGIGTAVIVAGVILYTNASSDNQVNEGKNQIQTIIGGVRKLYQSTNSYSTLTNTVAISARIFPANMIDNGTQDVRNPWKGDVTLTGTATSFTITSEQIPQDACIALITQNSVGQGAAVQSITVNGTAANATTGMVAPDVATSRCSISTTAGNTIAWTVR